MDIIWIGLLVAATWFVFAYAHGRGGLFSIEAANITRNDSKVESAFRKVAINMVSNRYYLEHKDIYTQSGRFRADFEHGVSTQIHMLENMCFDGNSISTKFLNYINNCFGRTRITVVDLQNIIEEYLVQSYAKQSEHDFDFFMRGFKFLTPDEFFRLRNGNQQSGDVVGVYVIHNISKDMYYVGQAKRLFFRINQHFTGHGNGDVYADYKYGDEFKIKLVTLNESGYSDLDKLEKDLIAKYDAYNSGYNRTSGNG